MSRAELMRTVGTSGRRMSRQLFSVLSVLLLLLGCACGPTHAANGARTKSVTVLETGRTKVPEEVSRRVLMKNVRTAGSLFLAPSNGEMLALADAQRIGRDNDETEMALGFIDTKELNWIPSAKDGNIRKPQWFNQGFNEMHYSMRSPTAVVKDNTTYLLFLTNRGVDNSKVPGYWRPVAFIAAFTGEPETKKIKLTSTVPLYLGLLPKINKTKLSVFPGSSNSALLTSKGKVVFSANATNREGKWGFAIMRWDDDKEEWGVSFVKRPEECRHFSLFEWKERLISSFSGCSTDTPHLKEYDEVAAGWKDVDATHFRFLSSKRTIRDFTPATIGNKNVLLFTEESTAVGLNGKRAIPLWLTDSIRTHYVGLIYTPYDNATSGGLLYTNGELFFTYQNAGKDSRAIVLARLDDELRTIKQVLNIWAENDAYLSRPCSETAPEDASAHTLCVTPMPTDGLVGFLSNTSYGLLWRDEYQLKNVEVRNGTKVDNGYTFSGSVAGTKWQINDRPLSGWYDFSKSGLTVVATVIVNETSEGDTPLLTVSGNGVDGRWGFWCKGGQWKVVFKNGEESVMDLETQKEYRVALMVHNNTISVYVNGNSLGSPLPISAPGEEPFDIKDVFIAGYDRGSGINMTVTNVLLYNRLLSDTELEAASRTIAIAQTSTNPEKTPEPPTDPKETPEPATDTKETSEPATDTKETPGTPTDTENTPGAPTDTEKISETSTDTKEIPETPTDTEEIPETPTDTEKTPKTPTDPSGDSSEHVRMGVSLLCLLGLRALALFVSAPI